MMHILRHSPHSESHFSSCLRTLDANQTLVLIEEAVYALLPATSTRDALEYLPASVIIYAVESDVLARGLALDDLPRRVKVVDYAGMVSLCTEYAKVVSW